MRRALRPLGEAATHLWRSDPRLTATGGVMLIVLAATVIGLIADPRIITGAPAWLKPAKFAVSIAIYVFTLAWIYTFIPDWRRTRAIVGWTTAITLILEIVVISLQAGRGTTSHFNVGTPLDATLFSVMGLAIVVQTLSMIAVAVAVWRQPFTQRALGWALRIGIVVTILGASTGGLMTRPTATQIAEMRANGRPTVMGAHTDGAADGGPGLPGTGWSVTHGDVRVAHFIGLHALQVLPLFAWLVARRRPQTHAVRMTIAGAASYAALFGILLWQALRGQSIAAPDTTTLAVLTVWGAATAAALWISANRRAIVHAPAVLA